MQFFDFQEVCEVELLGTEMESVHLILFANYSMPIQFLTEKTLIPF
jgi:hypothetical protein